MHNSFYGSLAIVFSKFLKALRVLMHVCACKSCFGGMRSKCCLLNTADVPTITSEINFNQFKSVSTAFVSLTSNLTRLLRKADFHIIWRSCLEQINTPNGAQLLPEDVIAIKASKNVDKITRCIGSFCILELD